MQDRVLGMHAISDTPCANSCQGLAYTHHILSGHGCPLSRLLTSSPMCLDAKRVFSEPEPANLQSMFEVAVAAKPALYCRRTHLRAQPTMRMMPCFSRTTSTTTSKHRTTSLRHNTTENVSQKVALPLDDHASECWAGPM